MSCCQAKRTTRCGSARTAIGWAFGAGVDDRAVVEGSLWDRLRPAPVQDQPDDDAGGGGRPFDASLILGHSPTVSIRNYNRARAIEATRAHDERGTALEDGANPTRARQRIS